MVWACMHWPMDGLAAWTVSWFAQGCTGQWMVWQHGCYHGLGMVALANGWVGRMDASMFGHGWTVKTLIRPERQAKCSKRARSTLRVRKVEVMPTPVASSTAVSTDGAGCRWASCASCWHEWVRCRADWDRTGSVMLCATNAACAGFGSGQRRGSRM